MTGSTGRGLPLHDLPIDDLRAAEGDKVLAAREASLRYVGNESRVWIAMCFGSLLVLGNFDDAAVDRLGPRLLGGEKQIADNARLRDEARLNHLHARRPLDRAEVLGRFSDLFLGHCSG